MGEGRDINIEEKKGAPQTVSLPANHRRARRTSLIKRLFFAFLLVFFAVCVRLFLAHIFADGTEYAEAVSAFLFESGLGLPK